MSNYIYTGSDWNLDHLHRIYEECEIIGREELQLEWYPNVFEIVTYESMLDAYSSVGMPVMYPHWSFGKSFLQNYEQYKTGHMGLALEMVINTNPCINYLMEENSATAQALVIAHAAIGHNSFFKQNYMFQQWTQADYIIDYLKFAKRYIESCEEKYGASEVEHILDCAHSLQDFGVDKYIKPKILSPKEEEDRQKYRDENQERIIDELWSLIPKRRKYVEEDEYAHVNKFLPRGNEENLLYFLEKNSPILKTWQREILRIVRKIAAYFRPQSFTKTINEGWASTVHYYIMNRMYDKGLIDEGSMLEFLSLHSSVVYQPDYNSRYFSGFNPYHLGYSIFADIKRMSENPTNEDREWFPDIAGGNWVENWHYAMMNFRDDSLIQQFLSPKLIREMKLFSFVNDEKESEYLISDVHNEQGYRKIRKKLAESKNINNILPDIQVTQVDFETRRVTLTHYTDSNTVLNVNEANRTLDNFEHLWGFDVDLLTVDSKTGLALANY